MSMMRRELCNRQYGQKEQTGALLLYGETLILGTVNAHYTGKNVPGLARVSNIIQTAQKCAQTGTWDGFSHSEL